MARLRIAGEKPLDWVGSSKRDFLGFPPQVKDEMGVALERSAFRRGHSLSWRGSWRIR
jgi:phage-related protein